MQYDRTLACECKGRALGASYWADSAKAAKLKRKKMLLKKKGVAAIQLNETEEEDGRMTRLEEECRQLKGMMTTLQVDTQSDIETLRVDVTQKLTVVEAKADQTNKLQEQTLAAI